MENPKMYDSYEQKRKINQMKKIIKEINKNFDGYEAIYKSGKYVRSQFFRSVTSLLRKEVKTLIDNGMDEDEALKKILPKAYGIVKLACKLELGKTYYDVQLMAGILLNDGYVSEMATGEGKTITAALPVYLNALLGKGAHVVTPNVYLASRDYEEMRLLYNLLGLSCGLVEEMKPTDRLKKVQEKASRIVKESQKQKYYTPKEVEVLKRKAFEIADKRVISEDIEKRKKEYLCDVTYGSSHAFAFDYLYDLLEDDPKRLRMRLGDPNFLVIDEADAVLFDDAVTSFTISGTQLDSKFAISNNEKKSTLRNVSIATQAMDYIMSHKEITKEITEPFEYHKTIESDEGQITNTSPAIIYCPKTKELTITDFGRVIFYNCFRNTELHQILEKNRNRLLNMKFNGKPLLSSPYGKIELSPRILGILIQSNRIKDLTDSYEDFLMTDYQQAYQDISNSAYAWMFLKKDIDYKYTIPSESDDPQVERKISILMDGRVAEGRVYSNGMQQAVEAKEKILSKRREERVIIKDSHISDTLASIPVAAFFGRYHKFSGMTGTSAKDAFIDLYGIDTMTVPRNKKYNVIDHGDCLYETTDEKFDAILKDVITSHRKGQPVLLTTTSVGESIKLYNYISRGLKRFGIYENIPVLNANVNELRKEASIITRAGRRGAITIVTDMAGRGTDIRLGGSNPTPEMENEIQKTGGLKIIGSGHFQYNRSDRQMKGRTGRQGNLGEVVFYNDLEDLRRIGVNPKLIENFRGMLKNGPIIEEQLGTHLIRNVIEKAQAKAESITKENILVKQQFEVPVASCRNKYHDMKEQIRSNEDYHKVLEKMIKITINDIFQVATNTEPIIGTTPKKGKISKMNVGLFQSLAKEYLGLGIKQEAFDTLKTNEELQGFIERAAMNRLNKSIVSKKLVDSFIHRIWFYFEEYVENIKNQYRIACMIPGNNAPNKVEGIIYDAYMYAYHTVYSQIVKEVMHPIRNKEDDHFGIFKLQINSDSTVKVINPFESTLPREEFFLSDEDPCMKKRK